MPARELHRSGFPAKAASAINAGVPVRLNTGDVDREVLPCASANVEPFGIALATAGAAEALTVMDQGNLVKVTAIASLGAGQDIGVASSNGALGVVSGASGSVVWSIGKSHSAAAAGEVFSLYIRPRQLVTQP